MRHCLVQPQAQNRQKYVTVLILLLYSYSKVKVYETMDRFRKNLSKLHHLTQELGVSSIRESATVCIG